MKHEAHRNADAKGAPLGSGRGKLFFVRNEDETALGRRTQFSREKNTYARLDGPPLLIEGARVNSQGREPSLFYTSLSIWGELFAWIYVQIRKGIQENQSREGETILAPWVVDEMKSVDLKDKRLNARVQQVLSQLAAHPTASIPAACGGHAEMTAAYRLYDNDKVGFHNVLQPHCEATRSRMAAQPVVLLVPDTSEIDLTRPAQQVEDAGPLDGDTRRGVFLHFMHAFTPDGTPLGTVQGLPWARDDDKPHNATRTRGERAAQPIEEKESFRWLLSMHHAREEAKHCPGTQIIFVADSEADILDVLATGMEEPHTVDWIVRSCQDRALVDDLDESRAAMEYLHEELLAAPVLFRQPITVRGRTAKVACEDRSRRQPRQTREAVVAVRAARVTLRAPERSAGQLPDVTVNAVLVREENPPGDDVAVEWLLLASLPIDTIDQVRAVIQYYCTRWMIEILFRVLKSGCRVEKRQDLGTCGSPVAVRGGVPDCVLANAVCVPPGPELSGDQLRSRVRAGGVESWAYRVVKRQPPPKKRGRCSNF